MEQLVKNVGTVSYDNLVVGVEVSPMVIGITLKGGNGVLSRGSVIGIITASGLGVIADKAATDGSQLAVGVLCDDIDTGIAGTTANSIGSIYISGVLNEDALIFAEGTAFADYKRELRTLGIYTKKESE